MISKEQERILREQAKRTADKYIEDPNRPKHQRVLVIDETTYLKEYHSVSLNEALIRKSIDTGLSLNYLGGGLPRAPTVIDDIKSRRPEKRLKVRP